jgi:hypothetical protein
MHAVFSVKYPLVRGECDHSGKDKPGPDAPAQANTDVTEASTDGGEEASLEDKDDQGSYDSEEGESDRGVHPDFTGRRMVIQITRAMPQALIWRQPGCMIKEIERDKLTG